MRKIIVAVTFIFLLSNSFSSNDNFIRFNDAWHSFYGLISKLKKKKDFRTTGACIIFTNGTGKQDIICKTNGIYKIESKTLKKARRYLQDLKKKGG